MAGEDSFSKNLVTNTGQLSEEKLRATLESDYHSGEIVESLSGKISRSHYACRLGCSRAALWRYLFVFAEYEKKLNWLVGDTRRSVTERKLRSFLDRDYELRAIVYSRGGKISRLHYARLVGCVSSAMTPFIPTFSEFERKIERETERATKEKIRFLFEEDLASGNIVTFKNGKIVRRHYAKLLGCCPSTLSRFNFIFEEFEQKLSTSKSTASEGELRAVLESDLETGSLVTTSRRQINRRHYGSKLGYSRAELTRFLSIFLEYDQKFRAKSALTAESSRWKVSERMLRTQIEKDNAVGRLVTSRSGKINRQHYANLFGCSLPALMRLSPVLSEYEEGLEISTGPLRHLSEMRDWLTTRYAKGTIGIRGGKLDRLAFQAHFNLQCGSYFSRVPEIRSLLEEFDEKARRENYQPLEMRKELNRLRSALTNRPKLNRDRLTVNLIELAKVVGVSRHRLREAVFAEEIDKYQADVISEARASRIDPYVHGRIFPFSNLLPLWPERFLERIGVHFKLIMAGYSAEGVKSRYLSLLRLLEWVPKSMNHNCIAVVEEAINEGRITTAGVWEDSLFAYRDHLLEEISAGRSSESAVNTGIKSIRTILSSFSSHGILPDTSTPLPGIRYASRRRSPIRSVAEEKTVNSEGATDYIAFARSRYMEVCKESGTDISKSGGEEFIAGLASAMSTNSDLPNDPAVAVRLVLEQRLTALRERATEIVASSKKSYQRGRQLLDAAQIDVEAFEAAYCGGSLTRPQRISFLREFFPCPREAGEGQIDQGIANLLSLIENRYGGIPPAGSGATTGAFGQFYVKRYLEYGGLKSIAPLLNPNPDAVGAVLTLYLIESGANISVGRTLDRDCLEQSDLEDHRRITGFKARAKGKPIIVDLPEHSPAVVAMDWLLASNERLRGKAGADADRLFLMQVGQRVQLMTAHWFTNWFKTFAASTPGLEGAGLLPNMIRPSVLLHAALSNEGQLSVGMALGQHSLQVTQGYQQKWPTRHLYDHNIRRFQNSVETLLLVSVEAAASKLGISVEQFEARVGELRETGLGTFCKDQRGRPEEKQRTCSTLDCWNDCPHLLIVAEVEAITYLQLWQSSLKTARPEWERDRPERWEEVWLPWLCLTTVVEEKMVRGPMIKIWKAAQKRASELSAQPDFIAPQPW